MPKTKNNGQVGEVGESVPSAFLRQDNFSGKWNFVSADEIFFDAQTALWMRNGFGGSGELQSTLSSVMKRGNLGETGPWGCSAGYDMC